MVFREFFPGTPWHSFLGILSRNALWESSPGLVLGVLGWESKLDTTRQLNVGIQVCYRNPV